MHFLYLLYSPSIDRYYIGQSSNVEKRVQFHNSEINTIWSKKGKPWILVGKFAFPSKKEALAAERYLKAQKSRKLIQKIIEQGYQLDQGVLINTVRASDPD